MEAPLSGLRQSFGLITLLDIFTFYLAKNIPQAALALLAWVLGHGILEVDMNLVGSILGHESELC